MKKSIYVIIFGVIICAIGSYQSWTMLYKTFVRASAFVKNEPPVDSREYASANDVRESISFILGDDKDGDNRYYEEAAKYYTYHPDGQTDYVVATCRSLEDVRLYLQRYKPCNGLPWGLINLVAHGNQWTGLSVRIASDKKRSTAARIQEYMQNEKFITLPETIVDHSTGIFLHGCGVGNDKFLVDAIALFFSSATEKPKVMASRLFEYYASVKKGETIVTEKYLAKSWHVSFRMGEKPPITKLMNELREKYPDEPVDWNEALSRRKPRRVGEVYYHTFEVPVKWIIPVSDAMPDLKRYENQLLWLRSQEQILKELNHLQLGLEKFAWSFSRVFVTNTDGSKSPALWVKGYCTILTVLQPLTREWNYQLALQKPFTPSPDDNYYYYSSSSLSTGFLSKVD